MERTKVIMEIRFGQGGNPGEILLQLYDDICPKYVENFKAFVRGDLGEKMSYKMCYWGGNTGSIVCGEMTNKVAKVGDKAISLGMGDSIYPGKYGPQKIIPYNKPYMLETLNMDSIFHINFVASGGGQAFGEVLAGFDVCERIGNAGHRGSFIENCYLC